MHASRTRWTRRYPIPLNRQSLSGFTKYTQENKFLEFQRVMKPERASYTEAVSVDIALVFFKSNCTVALPNSAPLCERFKWPN